LGAFEDEDDRLRVLVRRVVPFEDEDGGGLSSGPREVDGGEMPTRYGGSEEEVRALDAFIKLMRAAESVAGRLAPALAAEGLTTSQFGVLEALLHLGPMHQKTLAHKLLKTGGNITLVLDNLEKRGLVRRERDAADRRFCTVHLTEEGEALIAGLFPRHAAAIREELSVLSAEEQVELGRLCRKLGLRGGALTG
jgi:MarR family 2-MHQ and catechol resistance regulon transcriptional repressor